MTKLTLEDLPLKGKRVLMRVDFNVPLSKTGEITDDSRIRAALPSIEYILKNGASLILISHLGRPKAKPDPQFSLTPCAKRLSELLHKPVSFASDCIGPSVEKMASQLKVGQIILLENVRFHEGEEEPEKDPSFVSELAKLGDLYVNDAFGTAHRAHASTAFIARLFPHKAAMGFLMQKELSFLSPLLHHSKHPFYAILGGAKVSTKAGIIHSLLKKVDALYLGGAMIFTFLKAKGGHVGDSLVEESEIKAAGDLIDRFSSQLHFPVDLVIANAFSNDAKSRIISITDPIPNGWRGMDIGPQTVQKWSKEFEPAQTIFWNGPLGVFEMAQFAAGTAGIAKSLSHSNGQVIVGGGDSVAAVQQMGFGNSFAHLSTGGGASLEYLEFGHLPGIDALSEAIVKPL